MKKSVLDHAVKEAFRFLEAAKAVENNCTIRSLGGTAGYVESLRHTGAVKRASMDLTRALADLRRRAA